MYEQATVITVADDMQPLFLSVLQHTRLLQKKRIISECAWLIGRNVCVFFGSIILPVFRGKTV